jgi:hypothetical protein
MRSPETGPPGFGEQEECQQPDHLRPVGYQLLDNLHEVLPHVLKGSGGGVGLVEEVDEQGVQRVGALQAG